MMLPIDFPTIGLSFSDFTKVDQYWYALVSAIAGAYIGVELALMRSARAQRRRDRENIVALIKVIQRGIIKRAQDAADAFKKQGQPSFPIDFVPAAGLSDRISRF